MDSKGSVSRRSLLPKLVLCTLIFFLSHNVYAEYYFVYPHAACYPCSKAHYHHYHKKYHRHLIKHHHIHRHYHTKYTCHVIECHLPVHCYIHHHHHYYRYHRWYHYEDYSNDQRTGDDDTAELNIDG